MQLYYSQCLHSRSCARSLGSETWPARGWTRWPFCVAAAHSPGKRHSNSIASLGAATPTPRPPRAVGHSGLAGSSRGVEIDGKLLFQSFVASSGSQLKLSLQLVSATVAGDDGRGVKGKAALVDAVIGAGESELDVKLPWDKELGSPGAVVVTNHSDFPINLQTVSLPGLGSNGSAVNFICYGWVYPVGKHPYRLFFTNDTYVKENTPHALVKYREDELNILRGEGATEPFQEWDRVYDYALYNDLGNPDLRKDLARPVLGGSKEYPYPRRAKTGRPSSKTDPHTESRAPLDQPIYIPCDERVQAPTSGEPQPGTPITGEPFKSFAEIYNLFSLDELGRLMKATEVINSDAPAPTLPVPQVISVHRTAWRTDEEFAREMLAGTNPVSIRRVSMFPLRSKLNRAAYGDHDSKITEDHIENNLGGMTVQQAVVEGRLYVVDHHDWVMQYLKRINEIPGPEEKNEVSPRNAYAARTLFFLNDDSTLKPLAIELSSPNPENEKSGAISMVYTPPHAKQNGTKNTQFPRWELAKLYAAANDTCQNNFVSHWLNTHASMEPFVIATNRQLSVLHPIHRLLKPHFRKTMNINSGARQFVLGSGDRRKNGDIYRCMHEVTYFASKYSMEMSSKAYKTWKFTELALPADLVERGLAMGDPKNPEKLELLIKDYPYAVDGLDIWIAIKKWVTDYCAIYYANDDAVKGDSELQAWWWEVRHMGHGDKHDEPWWPRMDSVDDLVETCTTIIWVGSALHAAISFGQYAYCGFVPNHPCSTTRAMPAAGTEVSEADFLGSITPKTESVMFMSLSLASAALPEEVHLGQRPDSKQWTKEQRAVNALAEFGAKLESIAETIRKRNADPAFKNRAGPVEVPYTLLTPTTDTGPILRGIPNSITS